MNFIERVLLLSALAFVANGLMLSDASAQEKPVPERAVALSDKPDDGLPEDFRNVNRPVFFRTEAYAGIPLGIGRVTFRMRGGDEIMFATGAVGIHEADNRVLYPVLTQSPMKQFFQNILGMDDDHPDNLHTYWFLFKGNAPLEITLFGTGQTTETVAVEIAQPNKFARQLRRWWSEFTRAVNQQIKRSDYPSGIETYLMAMISRRLGLQIPDVYRGRHEQWQETVELLFDMEALRTHEMNRAMTGRSDYDIANLPLPEPVRWSPEQLERVPPDAGEIPIEEIAKGVPKECFYLRFGTWENQLWLTRLMEEYGGDLGRMVMIRGYRPRLQSKFLDQLAIESSELDKLFGGNLIDDVAIIGTDTYMDEGVSIGVMLHARSSKALRSNLLSKRKAFVKSNADSEVELEELEYEGVPIQFLKTPDNRYRSFYVTVDNHHLMSTSYKIAQRFIESMNGKGALADTEDFKFARYLMPLDREDTVSIYLPKEFFQQLLSPEYQIELRRRNRVITDIQLLELASMAAHSEGVDSGDLQELIRLGFLPDGFGNRPDQSRFSTDGHVWRDSIRGRRGFFTPIPDIAFHGVTEDEKNWFNERAAFLSNNISGLQASMFGIKRYQRPGDIERVVFDGRIAPFGQENYGMVLSMLGEPMGHSIIGSPDDILTFQASLRGGNLFRAIEPHTMFAAIQDRTSSNTDLYPTTTLRFLKTLKEIPGYLGGWPAPGYVDMLPGGLSRTPDEEGFSYARLWELWRIQWGDFSVLSFEKDVLRQLKGNLTIVDAERPAHIRLKVKDLVDSKLESWANSLNYRRGWQTSIANARLLNTLIQQFHLDPSVARIVAERIMNVELVCSLDGEYKLFETAGGRRIWASTAWPSFSNPRMPDDYSAPALAWFRGLELEVTKTDTRFIVHGFFDIKRDPSETGSKLPGFNLFKGFGDLMKGDSAAGRPAPGKDKRP